jgi:hypothetical protein
MKGTIVSSELNFDALVPAEDGPSLDLICETNLAGEGLDPSMLDVVKVPAGGATTWEIPVLGGETEAVKDLVGVIVGVRTVRSYFSTAYSGTKERPDCWSRDGITGDPEDPEAEGYGGRCSTCPKNQYGTKLDKDGTVTDGKACSERMLIMLLRPNSMLPTVVTIPPTSIREIKKLMVSLTSAKCLFYEAVVNLKLVKDRSRSGIEYSKVAPSFVSRLSPEQAASAKALYHSIKRVFTQVVEQTDSDF